jgi:hypothetical protein
MNLLRRLLAIYVTHRSVIALLFLMISLEFVFVLRLLWPQTFSFIVSAHLFEIVVLLAVAQMILILFKLLERAPRHVCSDEHECETILRERVASDPRAARLLVFSSGLGSRFDLITSIHRSAPREFFTQVLVQSPERGLDREDARRLRSNIYILNRDHPEIPLEVRAFDLPATIRGLILCDRTSSPLWGVASWYRYDKSTDGDVVVVGRRNPSAVFNADESKEDGVMLDFLSAMFKRIWEQSAAQVVYPQQSANPRG